MALKSNAGYLSFPEQGSAPATPAASNVKMYATTASIIEVIDSTGSSASITGGAESSGDLTDILITTPVDTEYLKYNTGNWVNATLPTIPTNIGDLSDVDTTGVSADDTLVRVGATFYPKKNQPALASIQLGTSDNGTATPDDGLAVVAHLIKIGNDGVRSLTGDDAELLELSGANSMYIPISDTQYDDHGLYMLHGWFYISFPFESGGDPPFTGNVQISWVNLDNATIDEEVILFTAAAIDSTDYRVVLKFPFKSDATVPASVRRYGFRIFSTDTAATYWHTSSLEKISHAYA